MKNDYHKNQLQRVSELAKVQKIREVTARAYKDLQPFVDNNFGLVPVFGYPLVCYTARDE